MSNPPTEPSQDDSRIREAVRERYGDLASRQLHKQAGGSTAAADAIPLLDTPTDDGCCAPDCCSPDIPAQDQMAALQTLYAAADTAGLPDTVTQAALGCGNPTALAELRPGETVLDLGSGGGIDCVLAAQRVGPSGRVIGVDMTDEMLALARANAAQLGAANVEFRKGPIEALPLSDASVDVVISNCVINLSTDKPQVLRETFRVLKPGGRFRVSDIVLTQPLTIDPDQRLDEWTGCVAGALPRDEFAAALREAGFRDVQLTLRAAARPGVHAADITALKPA